MNHSLLLGLFLSSFLFQWAAAQGENKRLQFNAEGKFKILQFTDLHYSYPDEDAKTLAVQETVLDKENPDLVIITGDLVTGYHWNGKDKDWWASLWRKFTQPMISRNISWAIALGNHDTEGDLSGTQIVDLEKSQPLSLTQKGPANIDGVTNYYLPIYSYTDPDEIENVLWMFDSGYNCQGVEGWGCVEYSQIAWYRNESSYLPQTATGLAFFHIPLYEHLDLWNTRAVYGNLGEDVGVCCSALNTGLYSNMHQLGNIKYVFCGHDHNNDFYGEYNGIYLGYGRKTGYGSYGPPPGWKRGGRVIELTQSKSDVDTWLRLEDGSIERQTRTLGTKQFMGCADRETSYSLLQVIMINCATVLGIVVVAVVAKCAHMRYKKKKKSTKTGVYIPMESKEPVAS